MKQVEKTTAIGAAIKQLMESNKGKFFSVTFIKADKTERTIVGSVRKVPGHDSANTIGHIEKYLTVVLAEKDEKGCEVYQYGRQENHIQLRRNICNKQAFNSQAGSFNSQTCLRACLKVSTPKKQQHGQQKLAML